eukprot:TRINITY_DN9017_c0_g2_i1.p1 TRINITY_DN9017_c0_g2~~TRINITY_DN9017_c0_g2_i1.p1  ORF type:complete len:197 (+),score=12.01 TRINITY_DN9017_c0_g2_i1:584-1174(+)
MECKIINKEKGDLVSCHVAFDQIVVDRGPSPYCSKLDITTNNIFLTKLVADGVIVSTPNGSTGYSAHAGGPIVHTEVPCVIMTPICAFSLTMRPTVFPEEVIIRIELSPESRYNCWLTFDGLEKLELTQSSYAEIQLSKLSLNLIRDDQLGIFERWIQGLKNILSWNSPFKNGASALQMFSGTIKSWSDKGKSQHR